MRHLELLAVKQAASVVQLLLLSAASPSLSLPACLPGACLMLLI